MCSRKYYRLNQIIEPLNKSGNHTSALVVSWEVDMLKGDVFSDSDAGDVDTLNNETKRVLTQSA